MLLIIAWSRVRAPPGPRRSSLRSSLTEFDYVELPVRETGVWAVVGGAGQFNTLFNSGVGRLLRSAHRLA